MTTQLYPGKFCNYCGAECVAEGYARDDGFDPETGKKLWVELALMRCPKRGWFRSKHRDDTKSIWPYP